LGGFEEERWAWLDVNDFGFTAGMPGGGEVAMPRRYPDSHANAGGLQDARYPFVNLPSTSYHWWFMKAIWEYERLGHHQIGGGVPR
jgi:hypothetical protein